MEYVPTPRANIHRYEKVELDECTCAQAQAILVRLGAKHPNATLVFGEYDQFDVGLYIYTTTLESDYEMANRHQVEAIEHKRKENKDHDQYLFLKSIFERPTT